MLVLTRKENETIVINNDIRVTIIHCGRGRVKIGIEAPPEVSIKRSELVERDAQFADRLPIDDTEAAPALLSRFAVG